MSASATEYSCTPSTALWLLDGRHVPDDALAHGKHQLSPAEADRYARFLRPERQWQYLVGRMLLRQAISHATGLSGAAISTIDTPGAGPQLLLLPESVQQPWFSLSHSRHWIACAVSFDGALGLDIEVLDPARDVLALASVGCHPLEHSWLRSQSERERSNAFYRLWTLKEALFKLASNAGAQKEMPPLVTGDGALLTHGDGWFCSQPEHLALAVTVCSARAAPGITWITPPAAWSPPD